MDLDLNDPEVQAAIEAAAKTQAEGQLSELQNSIEALQGNNAKLVDEKKAETERAKQLKAIFDELGGEDEINKLKQAKAEGDKAAALKMLVEGNFEEFQAAITEKAVAGYAKQVEAAQEQVEKSNGERDGILAKYNGKLIDIAVREAAGKAEVHPTAVADIVFRAQQQFSVHDDAVGLFDDNGIAKIGADGKTPYSIGEWLEEQRETAPHWWPASQGGGAGGSQGGGSGGGGDNPWSRSGWNLTKQGQVIKQQGMEKAEQLAKAAGSKIGSVAPPAR